MTEQTDVVIVGGGITGLVATHKLATARPNVRLCLLERSPDLGGKISTERVDGFVIEGGPDCFLAMKTAGIALCRELGLGDSLRGTSPTNRRSFIKRKGSLNELPAGLTGLVPSRIAPLLTTGTLSILGRLRSALEYFIPRRSDGAEETIAEFATRRFGREAYEWLVEPLMAGIHAGDGTELSLAATFPQLVELERENGSLLRAVVATRRTKGRTNTSAFLTPENGLRDIVDTLLDALSNVDIRKATTVEDVSRTGKTYRVTLANGIVLSSRAVVLATPAFATSSLVRTMAPELATILGEIPFVATAIVTLAYKGNQLTRALDGSGYVSPRAEGGPVVACSWTSSKFMHRAPEGTALLRVFIGRAGQDAVVHESPETLVAIARQEVERTLGAHGEPILVRVAQWPNALPQYNRGHVDRVARIEAEVAKLPGLELAGASYKGVGIPDCIQSGWDAAESIGRMMG